MPDSPNLKGDLPVLCITDVGSTTTKARLFLREKDGWRVEHAESPTTVERPHEDVTVGVQRALETLEMRSGVQLWSGGRPAVPYLSTSSAGGGLAMVVTGLVASITSRSAERVALGAGAIVLDVVAMDDGRTPYGKVQALESLRPDIVLLAGGFDGDNLSGPVFLAEMLNEAALRPKLNPEARLPVIFAGNAQAVPYVQSTLSRRFALCVVDNLRPAAERENLGPAHQAIHAVFMDHVMSQAPGYPALLQWVAAPVLPTPSAFGEMLALASREERTRILAIDIGGATTDVFTAENGQVHRTVSANLGMSYSILHVLRRVGTEAICALLDPPIDPDEVVDRIGGKLLRPTRLPATEEDIRIERAVAALAIREAVRDHLAVLRGVSLDRAVEELRIQSVLNQGQRAQSKGGADDAAPQVRPRKPESLRGYELIVGSGGILSHAAAGDAAAILVSGLSPDGRVELAIDRGFVIPHLGILAGSRPDLALELFHGIALQRLGTVHGLRSGAGGSPAATAKAAATRTETTAGTRSMAVPATAGTETTEGTAAPADADAQVGECAEIREELIRVRRELIVPGEVGVQVGQIVESKTVVARCTRLFPRPFFLQPAAKLQCAPEETASFLLKERGDIVEAGTLLARRKTGRFSTKEFHSPVAGTVEQVLPDGTVIVRERPEMAQEAWLIDAARELGVQARRLGPYLRCRVGQEVDKGQWLAADTGGGFPSIAYSPGRGRVDQINLDEGTIRIHPLREELQVTAWLPGTVVEITPRGAVVEGSGVDLAGAWGAGRESVGPLLFDVSGKRAPAASQVAGASGSIVAHDGSVTRVQLEAWAGQGVAGVIAAGARLAELLDWSPPYPLVLCEGFGPRRFSPEIRAALAAHLGGWTLLDATTEIRVGVRRPRVILVSTRSQSGQTEGSGYHPQGSW